MVLLLEHRVRSSIEKVYYYLLRFECKVVRLILHFQHGAKHYLVFCG